MLRYFQLYFGLWVMSMLQYTTAVDKIANPQLNAKLLAATSQLDRLSLLNSSEAWVFDYTKQTPYWNKAPGGVVNANALTFPAAVKNEMTLAWINLAPCAMLPVHYHPRAVNWVAAISGNTTTYMFEENGANTIVTHLDYGKSTLFPRGSLHSMVNEACEEDAVLISALSNSDAGTVNVGQMFEYFPADVVNAAMGSNFDVPQTKMTMPPVGTGANWGPKECFTKCNIPLPESNSTSSTEAPTKPRLP